MSDNGDDDRFFEESDDFDEIPHASECNTRKNPGFVSNLTEIAEESPIKRSCSNNHNDFEGVFTLDEMKENTAPSKNFNDSQSFSFQTGDCAIEIFNSDRNQREFLRLDPLQSYNTSHYFDEKSWERDAKCGEGFSMRNLSRSSKEPLDTSKISNLGDNAPKSKKESTFVSSLTNITEEPGKCPIQKDKKEFGGVFTLDDTKTFKELSIKDTSKQFKEPLSRDISKNCREKSISTQAPKIFNLSECDFSSTARNSLLSKPDFQILKTPRKTRSSQCTSNASSMMLDSPTFILNCTSKNGGGEKILEADRPMLYFGFRPINLDSEDAIGLVNHSGKPLRVKYRVSPSLASNIFKLVCKPNMREIINANSKKYMNVIFCPPRVSRFKAILQIECTTVDGNVFTYNVEMLGFGGQSFIRPIPFAEKERALRISTSGRYQLFPRSISSFSVCFQNCGDRDAFVSIILQNNQGDELPTENACVNPMNFLLDKNNKVQRVDIRVFMQGGTIGGATSQQSLVNYSSRPSSAIDNTASSSVSHTPAFRILAFWSEERQRRRIKAIEKNKSRNRIKVLNRHVTWDIEGEQRNGANAEPNKLISQEDYRLFNGYLRYTLIDVLTRQSGRSSRNTSSRTVTGNTLIEMEPDNTLKLGDSLYMSHF